MKLPHRNFLHLAAGAAALSAVSRIAWAQTYPTRPVRMLASSPEAVRTSRRATIGTSMSTKDFWMAWYWRRLN